jgi:hypothetical protein
MKHAIWRLMENELRYHRNARITFYGLLLLVASPILLNVNAPRREVSFFGGPDSEPLFTFLLWLAVFGHQVITYRFITVQKAEQRLRFLLSLPVTRHEIGQARLNTVILLHAVTFVIVSLCGLALMTSASTGAVLCMITLSLTLSFLIMLLEIRRQRPLFTTVQWLIGIAITLTILSSLGLSPAFLLGSRPAFLLGSRWDRTLEINFLLTPLYTLTAVGLGYWYQVRFSRQNTFRE